MSKGKVSLVGAGPGDPGLITCKGLRALKEADLVIFDVLVPTELLDEVKPGCVLVPAGKCLGKHPRRQKEIDRLLVRAAKQGKKVVRLKGGDPFIFGRGGEEGEVLSKARIPFEVVPGVTSAVAVPAYAGIPLTHRHYNSAVVLLTGHGKYHQTNSKPIAIDWEPLAALEPLVILMGLKSLGRNMKALIRHGKDPKTPVAVIQWGTTVDQRTVIGTLSGIAAKVQKAKLTSPAVVVVGQIVKLKKRLDWFEMKPLFGKRILVTRACDQASELSERFRAEGAAPIEIPTIEIRPPRSYRPLDRAIVHLTDFDWIVFSSANGTHAFFERLEHHKQDVRALNSVRIALIGPATARALSRHRIRPDLVAKTHSAEGLLAALTAKRVHGKKILIARAESAREILPETLKKRGAHVTVVSCYRSIAPRESGRELKRLFKQNPPELLTFASSSMVRNFVSLLSKDPKQLRAAKKLPAACIGPITAQTAKKLGFKKIIEPKKSTIPDLVAAVVRYY